MGLIANLFEFRSESSSLTDPKQWLIDFFGGGAQSNTGLTITPTTAMKTAAVYACVRLLAQTVGCVPCIFYQRKQDGGRERARNHPLYNLLNLRPNKWQTPLEFKEMMTGHVALRGNAYAHLNMNQIGVVTDIVPLHPDRVEVVIQDDLIVGYYYTPLQGSQQHYIPREMMHLRGLSSDGLLGISPVSAAREGIGLSLAAEEHEARMFSNGASIRGVLQTDAVLKKDAFDRLKTQFNEVYSGLKNTGKTAVLESGVKWQSIGMTAKDAEFLELRKFQIVDVARWFGVPPHLIGDLEHGTMRNIEQQSLEFLQFTMIPWFERWQQAISRDLMSDIEAGRYYAEFLIDVLLRADITARYNAYAVARQWGWMSADDIRMLENMNPLPNNEGKLYLSPMNMIPSDQVGKLLPAAPGSAPGDGPGSAPAAPKQAPARNLAAIRLVLLDAAKRIVAKEVFGLRKLSKKPDMQTIEAFYFRNNASFRTILDPVVKVANLSELSTETSALWHGVRQVEELRGLFEGGSEENLRLAFEKCLDDWTELKPEEMTAEWMKSLEVTQ